MNPKRQSLARLAALSLAAAAPAGTWAQTEWPTRPVKLILPYPPGGATDRLARLIAAPMGPLLGQPVIVENRPGATGALGSSVAANANPDGYTLLVGFLGSMVLMPLLNRQLAYDPQRDFIPITRLVTYDFVLVTRPDLPATDLAGVIKLSKQRSQSIAYGSTGIGSPGHLGMEEINRKSGATLRHVPYKGDQAMLTDLLGEHVEMGVLTLNVAEPLIRAGKLKALAIATDRRSPKLPEVPTFAESGFSEAGFETWAGLMAPRETPAAVIARLDSAAARALQDPELRAALLDAGFTPAYNGPDAFKTLIEDDRQRYSRLIEASGVQIN
ncbi:MAG: tripartite tricarboxylate transporter substrate binding protein [Burkholderiaceae bacterium]